MSPAASQAAWTNPFPISGVADQQDVAVDAAGKAVVVWRRGADGLTFVATRDPDGTLSHTSQVTSVISSEPAVATNAAAGRRTRTRPGP